MSNHKYTLVETKCLLELSCKDLYDHTSECFLLLLYRDSSEDEFGSLYGIVFNDWEVIDNMGKKFTCVVPNRIHSRRDVIVINP